MRRRTLFGLSQSPWTERARWALDHHGVLYSFHQHVPMLGELLLRRKARAKKATVPLFVDGDEVVMDSLAIARYAERIGRGASLFPRDSEEEVTRWVGVADRMLQVGRAWLMRRILASRAAREESLPSFIPQRVRGPFAPTTLVAVKFLMRKYDVPADVDAEVERVLRPLSSLVREAIRNRPYVLSSSFSFIDVALASAMQVIQPRSEMPLGPAVREAWTNASLARDYGDLLEWRDAIYSKHR